MFFTYKQLRSLSSFSIIILLFLSCNKGEPQVQLPIEYNKHILPNNTDVISKIAFSSGCKQLNYQGFWSNIENKNPDLWIWGGDNIYSDTEDPNVLKHNYEVLKQNSYYQDFISNIPVLSVWDDHDYGVRDGGVDYSIKDESKEEFMRFFDIPEGSDIRHHDGIYSSYELGQGERKIKIFLLDNRYFKTELQEDNDSPNWYLEDNLGTVLGNEQWSWLETEILNSNALINIFVSGLQVIPNNHIYEKWGNFPLERQRFLDLIESSNINNPVILSGDRHYAEFSIYTFNNGDEIVEFTASGMTHSFEGVNEENIYRTGSFYDGKNFGILEIQWSDTPMIKYSIYDISGEFITSIER